MKSLDIANRLITLYGDSHMLTNMKLNKLVYFAQTMHLRDHGEPLFDDPIEAWEYGPVEPLVYHAFESYGRNRIAVPSETVTVPAVVDDTLGNVMMVYGDLPVFDLVRLACRSDGAWAAVHHRGVTAVIEPDDILRSRDGLDREPKRDSIIEGARHACERWPNTMRLLAGN